MSYYCKGKDCPKSQECHRLVTYWLSNYEIENLKEGYETGVWFVNEQNCINNKFCDGVFPKEKLKKRSGYPIVLEIG